MSQRSDIAVEIFNLVDYIFDYDEVIIEQWWASNIKLLNGKKPIDFLDTIDNMEILRTYLIRVNYGVYT